LTFKPGPLTLFTILFAAVVFGAAGFWGSLQQSGLRLKAAATEKRYRLLFERSVAETYRTSPDGRILDCNLSFCHMFGYASREQVLNKSVASGYLSTDDRNRFIAALRAEKYVTNFEQRLRRADKSTITVLNSATLVEDADGAGQFIEGTLTDITELRNAELEQRRLAAIVQSSDDAILSLTLEGIIETWNPGAERIFGYGEAEIAGNSITILAAADCAAEYLRILEGAAKGIEERIESIAVVKGGMRIDVALSLSPITDLAGRATGIAAIARDITDRKKAEKALRNSEVQYRLLFQRNPVPMWVFDRNTLRFLAVNKSAIRQYGYSEQEFLGMKVLDIRPEETIPLLREDIAQCKSGLQPRKLWQHRRKDGSLIDADIVCHELDFNGVDAILVAAFDVTERERAKKLLEESEGRYRVLFQASPDAYWLSDENGFIDCNTAALELFGYSDKSAFTNPAAISPLLQPDGRPSQTVAGQRMAAAFRNGKERFEWVHLRKNGEPFHADVSLASLCLNGRNLLLGCVRDIDDRKRAEEALLFKSALLEAQSETTLDGILVVDDAGKIILANQQFQFQFGVPRAWIEAQDDKPLLNRVMDLMESPEAFLDKVNDLYAHPNQKSSDELRLKDGRTLDRYSAPLIDSNGGHRGRIWYFRDITDRKKAEERAQHLAYYDALTELPNRTLMRDRLEVALARARTRGEEVAVLLLDLDRFAVINDSLGRSFGDELLKDVARRLRQSLREQDTVARIGDDEFVIVLADVRDPADARVTASWLMECLSQPFEIQDQSLNITCSIGIVIFPQHGSDRETLARNAATAMHHAKNDGRNTFRFFTEELNRKAGRDLALETALRKALPANEFFLVYQPQVEIATGKTIGMEALIRWRHPELGLVPPDQFIPIAERIGLILSIGEWVLKTACTQVSRWLADGLFAVPVSVNVSAVQFRNENFSAIVRKILAETGLPPEFLELELTEGLLVTDTDQAKLALHELAAMGVKVAIDDFGTGYSSLSYLKQFRVNKLKIDRSFVKDLPLDAEDAAITTAIISMARSMNLRVIAEGVETEEQMSFLRQHQCDEIQGYYFSPPVLPSEMVMNFELILIPDAFGMVATTSTAIAEP
jgi:diguanylate cyclase (GGDEF)-like protein/PAS domain S-box-containing protein